MRLGEHPHPFIGLVLFHRLFVQFFALSGLWLEALLVAVDSQWIEPWPWPRSLPAIRQPGGLQG